VGARDLSRRSVGFGDERATGDADREYKRMFSPEFRNRLDARVSFSPLSSHVMDSIVGKFLVELEGQLAARQVTIELSPEAKTWLAEKGYDPDQGARPLARVIQSEIKKPLGDELLFGKLEHGGKVTVGVKDGELTFEFVAAPPTPPSPESPKEPAKAATALAIPVKTAVVPPLPTTKKTVLN
jgi:ATP-dependent Clp protease ATP-binding subunit ClpA